MAGLLDSLTEAAKNQYSQGVLSNLLNNPQQSLNTAYTDVKNLFNPAYMKNVQGMSLEDAKNLALDANPMMGAITAWHGSPDIFKKFDATKIGNANGAAYGHGINITEQIPTAEFYKNLGGAKNVDMNIIQSKLTSALNKTGLHPDITNQIARKPSWFMENPALASKVLPKRADPTEVINTIQNVKNKYYNPSNSLYKLDLPDTNLPYMLNWHLPLSEQTSQVQNAISNSPIDIKLMASKLSGKSDPTGEAIYHSLGNDINTAKQLNELGIKGTKFIDTMARGNNINSSNYTIFNPDILQILERNGLLNK